jgi:hypothetical protein
VITTLRLSGAENLRAALNCYHVFTFRRSHCPAAFTMGLISGHQAPRHCHEAARLTSRGEGQNKTNPMQRAVPWLRRSVAGLPPLSLGFVPKSIHVGFVVGKVALRQVVLRVLRFSLVKFHSTAILCTHVSSEG